MRSLARARVASTLRAICSARPASTRRAGVHRAAGGGEASMAFARPRPARARAPARPDPRQPLAAALPNGAGDVDGFGGRRGRRRCSPRESQGSMRPARSSRRPATGSFWRACAGSRAVPTRLAVDFERAQQVLEQYGPLRSSPSPTCARRPLQVRVRRRAWARASAKAVEVARAAGADFERVWASSWWRSRLSTSAGARRHAHARRRRSTRRAVAVIVHRAQHRVQRRLDSAAHDDCRASTTPRGARLGPRPAGDHRHDRTSR
jgi:hypothetical protein